MSSVLMLHADATAYYADVAAYYADVATAHVVAKAAFHMAKINQTQHVHVITFYYITYLSSFKSELIKYFPFFLETYFNSYLVTQL